MSGPEDAKHGRARVLLNPALDTVYADAVLGGGPSVDNVTLTLGVRLIDHTVSPAQPVLKPTLQIVLPISVAEALGQLAQEIAARMRLEREGGPVN